MTKLSVNVNKIATLRNARGKNTPDVLQVSRDIISYGAHGITVHPRPDERHIRKTDVYALADMLNELNQDHERFKGEAALPEGVQDLKVEFNVEGYPSEPFLAMMEEVQPDQCTLVPDPPDVITSNAGWNPIKAQESLTEVVGRLRDKGIRTSLFINPFEIFDKEIEALMEIRPDRVELYTEAYAEFYESEKRDDVTAEYARVANRLHQLGLGINAGHDLNLNNIEHLVHQIPCLTEVSIGHALISEALYLGLKTTVKQYLEKMNWEAP